MPTKQRDLTALLGSRICHDLISPLGAIGNGVELLQMSGATNGPEMGLIVESVSNANARIRFFRVAFGAASQGQTVDSGELCDILKNVGDSGRVKFDLIIEGSQLRAEAKLAFLLILCLETTMPYGGNIAIESGGTQWQINATAEKMKIDPDIWSVMSNPNAEVDITPALVHFALIPDALREAQKKMSAEIRETEITIRF